MEPRSVVICLVGAALSVAAAGEPGIYGSVDRCLRDPDLSTCLRVKAITMLDEALARESPLQINDYLALARDPAAAAAPGENATTQEPLAEEEVRSSLPQAENERSVALDDMIADRVARFLRTRTLQFTLPADLIEGRRKKGRGGMMLMAAMAMAGMMVQMAMGKIAMIAGKALLVGKMALLLSAIVGLKKLLGGGGGGESHQVVYATDSHGGGGWSRSMDLPYRAHARALHSS